MDRVKLTPAELRKVGELRHAFENDEGGQCEDFALVECVGGDLSELDLSGIIGVDALLPGVSFRNANLSIAMLDGLIAPRANFDGATLVKASLYRAQLAHSSFVGAKLFRASLADADLRGADLRDADLRSVSFDDSDIRGAIIDGARFGQYTTFVNARLDFDPDRLVRE